ncbi:putative cutinase [Drechmeria coniospora]|uniref:Cutinase n=1 Tax=Drechmeria coniospora TaxID=98403 RepID=A0A151GLZ3_DRECN|nr:putative cutinase [Drechmeria coniospora]KYK58123.1 putative cutinase [Drechmeria coniospora]ODA83038.1 hypothetical protein RJ55_01547 [Drechmeria coniospora]
MRFPLLAVLAAASVLAHPADLHELDARSWPDVTAFLAKVAALFPVNVAIQEICGAITAAEVGIATFFRIPLDRYDGCGDVTMLFARGTCDAGNVGVLTGPWFFKTLADKLWWSRRSLAVQGFEYPATVDGYFKGSKDNGWVFANVIKNKLARCPGTKLVLSGYSQGGMVIHQAAAVLDRATMSKVSAVVIFGDPYSKRPISNIDASKVKIFCHEGDNICDNGPLVLWEHLNYAEDAEDAADFIISRI